MERRLKSIHSAERAVPKLWPFIKGYRDYVDNKKLKDENFKFRATRVAVIDNGIMNTNPPVGRRPKPTASGSSAAADSEIGNQNTPKNAVDEEKVDSSQNQGVSHRVVSGQSFLDETHTMGAWSFASDPHGTQMANLICAIDPRCEIYVAKIIEGRYGIVPKRLARVSFTAT